MRFSFFLSFFLLIFNVHGQQDCSAVLEAHVYELTTTLCEEYGDLPPTLVVTDGSSDQYPAGWNNEVVLIFGTFTINTASFKIDNSTLQFTSGADILVKSGNELIIDKSFLFSCEDMWKGIDANFASIVKIYDSHIEDAQYAILAKDAQQVFSNNSIFDRNWVAVRLNQKTYNPGAFYTFSGNQFRGNMLKPPYAGQSPTPGPNSFAGVWARAIPYATIGNGGINNLNEFKELNIGVISEGSNLAINSTSFESMLDVGIVEGFQTGIGIMALRGSFINQMGMGKNSTSTPAFTGCHYAGIFCEESTCYTQKSRYARLGKYGVYAVSQGDHFMRIFKNRFENTNTTFPTINAVLVDRSTMNDDQINDNYILSNKPSGGALIVLRDIVGGVGEAEILRDTILSTSSGTNQGIELRPGNGENFRVSNNLLTFNHAWMGLRIFDGGSVNPAMPDNCVVSENKIEVFNSGALLVVLANVQNVTFCNNEMLGNSAAFNGLYVQFNCSGSVIGQNLFDDMDQGMRFQGSGINMGSQNHHGNRWENGFTLAAEHTGGDHMFSLFFVNSDPFTCGDPNYIPNDFGVVSVLPINGWFFDEPNICVNECTDLYDELMLQPVYEATVSGEGQEMGWSAAAQWAAEDFLYRTLQSQTNTGLDATDLNAFNDAINGTATPALLEKGDAVRLALSGDEEDIMATRAIFEDFYTAFNNHTEQLQDWLEEGELGALDMTDWLDASEAFKSSLEERKNQRDENIAALTNWSTIVSSSLIEEQLKVIEQIRLNWLVDGELSQEEWNVVEDLAIQCYDQYGPAVFKAQTLLPSCRWKDLYLAAEAACGNQGIQDLGVSSMGAADLTGGKLTIFPNPSKNRVQVQFSGELLPDDQLFLYDIYGKEMLRQAAEKYWINVGDLPIGIYFLQWKRGATILATEKLLRS